MTSASPVPTSVGLTLIGVLFGCVEVEVCVSAGIIFRGLMIGG